MDVGEWLRRLGLGQYETIFREHAIDMDVLVDLTDGELARIFRLSSALRRRFRSLRFSPSLGSRIGQTRSRRPADAAQLRQGLCSPAKE